MHSDLKTLDPVWTTSYQTRDHGFLVFDTLFGLDSHFKHQPQMAEGAVSEDDGKTGLFTTQSPQALIGAMSIQRRSFQLCSAHSASCTPLAPSSSVNPYGAFSQT